MPELNLRQLTSFELDFFNSLVDLLVLSSMGAKTGFFDFKSGVISLFLSNSLTLKANWIIYSVKNNHLIEENEI